MMSRRVFLLAGNPILTSVDLILHPITDVGLSHVDKYTYSFEGHIKAGALFATGLLNTGNPTNSDTDIIFIHDLCS